VDQDRTDYDFIIIGSGAGSVIASLVLKDAGKTALIIEKEATFGGSTALSGGVVWVPCNAPGREAGVRDRPDLARDYLDACAGPLTKGSSRARRDAFLDQAPAAIDYLRAKGMKLVHAEGYADYHEGEYPGGLPRGRAIVPAIFDMNDLGEAASMIGWSPAVPPVMTHEAGKLTLYGRTLASKKTLATVGLRMMQNRLRGKRLVGIGLSLQGRLLQIALRNDLPILLDTPVTDLLVEDGAVTGVTVMRNGRKTVLRARSGVLINAGGFARNAQMRAQHLRQPSDPRWTVSNAGDTGEMQQAAMALGADVENMDLCWWVPGTLLPDGSPNVSVFEHARPHAILVDQQGRRFTNEATSYVRQGLDFYARHQAEPAIPAWIIIDARHRKRYMFGQAMPGKTPETWFESGYMKRANTIGALAEQCGIPADALRAEIDRFNGFARNGRDEDFHRGEGAYARYLGDPTHRPNPSLGTIEQAPFYAVAYYPCDVGTCGGLVSDEHARVLRQDGTPIAGLYACGNSTACVCGPSYPGAGASISASLTFGFVAARHAARPNDC
jgi:3-oxosteroid 1-dehydrogenase